MSKVIDVPLNKIISDHAFNCRGKIRHIEVADLVSSIDQHGQQMPIQITPLTEEYVSQCKIAGVAIPVEAEYFLIAGFRRYSAMSILNAESPNQFKTIKAIVTDVQYKDAALLNLTENLIRLDLNIVQEAQGIKRMYDAGYTEAETCKVLSKTRGWVQIRFMILKLPDELHSDIISGNITQPDIRSIYSVWKAHKDDGDSYIDCKNAVFEMVRKIKDKNLTKSVKRKPTPTEKKNSKHIRGKNELSEMQTFIYNNADGHTPETITLGWALGELTTGELLKSVEEKHGIESEKFLKDY